MFLDNIDIYSYDHNYSFTFWTKQEYNKFNNLEFNKKTDVLDFIDDYDIDFGTKECSTINSRKNTEIYFTKIGNNKYKINALIRDFEQCVIGKMDNHRQLKLETIINFNE